MPAPERSRHTLARWLLPEPCGPATMRGGMRPVGPAVDHLDGGVVGAADEEVLGAQRLAVGEIEYELAGSCGHCRR